MFNVAKMNGAKIKKYYANVILGEYTINEWRVANAKS